MYSLPARETLLLRLLSPTPPPLSGATRAGFDGDDWHAVRGIVRQHRLGPLLHWQLTRTRPDLPIPAAIRDELAASFKRSTVRSLLLQRELILIHRLLTEAGIPYQALKGAFLAFHVYPNAGTRPMRDLDILVPREQALRAFDVLLAGGLVRPAMYQGTPDEQIEIRNHLPPLHAASGRVTVEVHARLQNPDVLVADAVDLSETAGYWQRTIRRPIAGERIAFPDPTDLLLHLILHALGHRFDNGPLTLSDIGYLVQRETIDWTAFWQRASRQHCVRSCWLTLGLVERHWGTLGIDWRQQCPSDRESAQALETAAALMLRDYRTSSIAALARIGQQQISILAKLGLLLRRVFPARTTIAAAYPVRAKSPRVFLFYLPYIWGLVSRQLPYISNPRRRAHFSDDLQRLEDLERWLAD